MQRGDLVRPKKISGTVFGHDGDTFVFTDKQLDQLEFLIQTENYAFGIKERLYLRFKEVAIVLQVRVLFKKDDPWNVFVKILSSDGLAGWVARENLTIVATF